MTKPTPARDAPIRALVVDDDPLILALLSAFLQSRNYAVITAPDGEAALQKLENDAVDLIITDWLMPGIDGLALCRHIRKKAQDRYVYVIMLTSFNGSDSLLSAMEAGVDDFLAKPFSPTELGARLHAAARVLELHKDLAKRNKKLATAYEQLSNELVMAKELQLRFLPPPKCLDKVCFEWLFEASSYVGGDTFDYFCIDARHICFYVVDVAGHGVSSSLLAFNAQHQILAAASHTADLLVKHDRDLAFVAATMVADFNSKFLSMKDTSLYMTMIYGLLDMETGDVALVQAGHPPPLYSDPAQGTVTAVGDGGLPIGILPSATYEAHTLRLAPGSRLYIYSDGVPDCFNDASEAFGQERMQHILTEQQSAPLSKVHEAMRNALMAWHGKGGSFEDDVTFLAIEYGDHVIGRPKR